MLYIFIILCATLAFVTKKLTLFGSAGGAIIGIALWLAFSYTGILLVSVFFLLGTCSTMWGINKKYKYGLANNTTSQRDFMQVFANAGIPFLLSILSYFYPAFYVYFLLMVAGSFSAATADTLSSEMGNLYGKKFYNIITFKKDTKGLDGVVSLEGTLFGLGGSCIIAVGYSLLQGFNLHFLIIVLAGTLGNVVDSILGASLERKHFLQNNLVNFINTISGALSSLMLYFIFF